MPDETPNPYAYAAGIVAARCHELRGSNPFDAEKELGRYAEWDAGWLLKADEQMRASERAHQAQERAIPTDDLFEGAE